MTVARKVLEWVPLVVFIVIAIAIAAYCSFDKPDKTVKPPEFAPVTSRGLKITTPPPYSPGQEISATNGICNNSKDTLQMTISAGLQEDGDPLAAKTILEYPLAGQQPANIPLKPGCTGTNGPIKGIIPANTPPGRWRAFISLTIMGLQGGQVQRLTLLSDPFMVVGN